MSNPLRILGETRIDLEGVRPLLGTPEKPASMATVRRAMNVGGRTPDGGRVRLEYLKTGLKIITSVEAVGRYLATLNGIDLDGPDAVEVTPARTGRRRRELARVDADLDRAGI
jgi:hypothetical protein